MTTRQIDHACQGGSDVVHADPKKKRAKRDTFPAAEKFADKMFALYIKARDRTCVTAGVRDSPCTNFLQCSHVERRRHKATRYHPDNAYVQCSACHVYHHTQSESPLRSYAIQKIGMEEMDNVYYASRKIIKRTAEELRQIGIRYRDHAKLLESARRGV